MQVNKKEKKLINLCEAPVKVTTALKITLLVQVEPLYQEKCMAILSR